MKIYKILKIISMCVVLFIVVTNCTKDKIDPIELKASFSESVAPALNKCTGCHTDLKGDGVYNYLISNNWVTTDTSKVTSGKLYKRLTEKPQHVAPYLNSSEIDAILLWLEQGAQDN